MVLEASSRGHSPLRLACRAFRGKILNSLPSSLLSWVLLWPQGKQGFEESLLCVSPCTAALWDRWPCSPAGVLARPEKRGRGVTAVNGQHQFHSIPLPTSPSRKARSASQQSALPRAWGVGALQISSAQQDAAPGRSSAELSRGRTVWATATTRGARLGPDSPRAAGALRRGALPHPGLLFRTHVHTRVHTRSP